MKLPSGNSYGNGLSLYNVLRNTTTIPSTTLSNTLHTKREINGKKPNKIGR